MSLCLVALSWLFCNFEYHISTPFSRQFFWLYSHVSPILNKCKSCKRKTFVCNSKLHTCVRKLREIASHLSSSFITVLNKDFKGFQIYFLADLLSVHLIFVTSIWQYLARNLVFRKFLFLICRTFALQANTAILCQMVLESFFTATKVWTYSFT